MADFSKGDSCYFYDKPATIVQVRTINGQKRVLAKPLDGSKGQSFDQIKRSDGSWYWRPCGDHMRPPRLSSVDEYELDRCVGIISSSLRKIQCRNLWRLPLRTALRIARLMTEIEREVAP